MRYLAGLAVVLCACARSAPPLAVANDLRLPAQGATDTVRIALSVQLARWQPDTTLPNTIEAEAFGVDGGAPSIPGPVVHQPLGVPIVVTIRNTLGDTVRVQGFGHRGPGYTGDTIVIPPRATVTRAFGPPERGGVTGYVGDVVRGGKLDEFGAGNQLAGVLVAGDLRPDERIMALTFWNREFDSTGQRGGEWVVWAINGRSWPATERFAYDIGDTVRWRLVDLSGDEHPMHLHGFHFRVDGRTTWDTDSTYAPERRRLAVTEVPPGAGSVAITWVPTRAGQWLFHCHKAPHMGFASRVSILGDTVEPEMHAHEDAARHINTAMSGLIVGINVRGAPAPPDESAPAQRFRLLVQRRAGRFDGGKTDAYGYVLTRGGAPSPDSVEIPGPVLALTQGDLAEITVVNRLPVATTVHWHGLEIDSYYDGVGGWSGVTGRIAPLLASGDSFVVRVRPVRAGTFIYHTHLHESPQLNRGLVGAIVVMERGQRYDPATDHVVVLHVTGNGDSALVVANGKSPADWIELQAGRRQRFRFITMMADDVADITLAARDSVPLRWRPVAKDGAMLPAALAVEGPARVHLAPGETYDVEFTPPRGADIALRVRSYNPVTIPLSVQ